MLIKLFNNLYFTKNIVHIYFYVLLVNKFSIQFVNLKYISIELFHAQTIRFYVYDYAELNKS